MSRPDGDARACAVCGYDKAEHQGDGEMIHDFRPAAPAAEADLRADLAAESSRHGIAIGVKQNLVLCTCGWRDESDDNFTWPLRNWARHVADALLAGPLRGLVEQAAEAARLRERVEKVATTCRTMGLTLHSVPHAETYAEIAIELQRALGEGTDG